MSVQIDAVFCKGCELCFTVCAPKALKPGSTRNAKGYLPPECDDALCVSCGNCERICPEMAITTEEKKCAAKYA